MLALFCISQEDLRWGSGAGCPPPPKAHLQAPAMNGTRSGHSPKKPCMHRAACHAQLKHPLGSLHLQPSSYRMQLLQPQCLLLAVRDTHWGSMCWAEAASRMGGGQAACTHCSFLVFGKPLVLPSPAGTQLWGSQRGRGVGNLCQPWGAAVWGGRRQPAGARRVPTDCQCGS